MKNTQFIFVTAASFPPRQRLAAASSPPEPGLRAMNQKSIPI